MNKILDTFLIKPIKLGGIALLHLTGLRTVPDEKARIKEQQKKNKSRVIECANCGKVMKGAKDEKSDSDEEVLYTCENCGFKRDIRKERINPKSMSQFYNETQKKTQKAFNTNGELYKSRPGKLPDGNTCKAVFVSHLFEELKNCPYCGEELISLSKLDAQLKRTKNSDNSKQKDEIEKEKAALQKEFDDLLAYRRLLPSRMFPFVVPRTQVTPTFAKWIQNSNWIRPRSLKDITKPDVITGIYVPQFYIQKGKTRSTWSAMGEGSQNRIRKQPKDKKDDKSKGPKGPKSPDTDMHVLLQTGYLEGDFTFTNNASSGLMGDLMSQVRDLDPKKLVPYDLGYLDGWVYELYQKDVSRAFKAWQKKLSESSTKEAKKRVHGSIYSKIKDDGKKSEDIHVQTEVTDQKIEHIFVPIWVAYYRFNKKSYQFLMNGYTGKLAGKRPTSALRMAILYGLLAILVSLIVWLVHTYWHNGGGPRF